MPTNHFVAVGGTGQHAALALTDIAVLGEWLNPLADTRVWLFDADASGTPGNETAWDHVLKQSKFLLRERAEANTGWRSPTDGHHKPFDTTFEVTRFGDLLYDEHRNLIFSAQQQGVSFREGYFGQPAVAATLFAHLLDSPHSAFGDLLAAPREAQSRIVLVGSAVGGTGSGCLPSLAQRLTDPHRNNGAEAGDRLLSVLFLPWFRLEGSGPDAERRNQEMTARTASGLLYYQNKLAKRSPTVLLGQPDASLTRKTRPWSGDTQQPLHEDLTLPFYAAAVAAQFINGLQLPKGLYAVARPSENIVLHDRVPYDAQNTTLSSLRALTETNRELLRRLHWVIRYLEARREGFPPVFPFVGGFDVPALPEEAWSWTSRLREWLSFKERSLLRLEATLQPGVAAKTIANEPLVGGIPELRTWFASPTTALQHADAFCQMLATGVLAKPHGERPPHAESAERLLPERIAEATTTASASQAAPLRARVGMPTPLDPADVHARIHLDRVEPEQLPAGNSRAFLLRHRLSQLRNKPAPLRQMLSAHRLEDRPIDRLLQQWGLLFLLAAHGRIRVGGPLEHATHGTWLNLLDHLREPGSAAPRPILWNDERKEVVVGYSDPTLVFVPAPLTLQDWDRMLRALPADRSPLLRSVGSWARFLRQLGRAAKRKELDWLVALDRELLDPKEAEPLRPFGMRSGSDMEIRWDPMGATDGTDASHVQIKLPDASGRADDSWHSLFGRVGVAVTTQKPPGDATADQISDMLNALPTFQWFPPDPGAAPQQRRVLWVGSGAAALNLVVSQHLQERYYISPATGSVWDVEAEAADGGPVMAVRHQDVLLSEIGAMETFEIRYPDIPIRREFADLLDLRAPPPKPKVGADKRTLTYSLALRGIKSNVQHTATLDTGLKLGGGCLLWPKFVTPSWRERYVLLTARNASCTVLCSHTRDGQLCHQQALKVDPRFPIGFRLPHAAVYPRALVIHKQDGQDAGLFYLETTHITPAGVERWGVDFGTQASVIAIANADTGDTGTKLLEPAGASDATLVVHGPGKLPGNLQWFSTWAGEGPRQGAPRLMPSAFIWREPSPSDTGRRLSDESTYCREWMLDHGSALDGPSGLHLQSRFKWKTENGPSRRAYLLRLLEQATAWRAGFVLPGQASPLPQSVTLIFTLPLSMRDEVGAFERDIAEVAARLKEFTGVHFDLKYQWESIAASMPIRARAEDRVYAALDLGGGSFDLWGSFHHLGARGRTTLEDLSAWQSRAESYMLGGTALFDALVRAGLSAEELDAGLRNLDQDEAAYTIIRGAESYQTNANFFFDAVTEASARWLAALVAEARALGIGATTVDVSLLGRAWYLGDKAWQQPVSVLKRIAQRMATLGVEAKLEPFRDLPTTARERKSYLARAVAVNSDTAAASLTRDLDTHPGYVGTELVHESSKVVVPWTTRLPLSGLDPALRLKLHDTKGTVLHPGVPPALNSPLSRSQTEVDKGLNQTVLHGGFRSGDMKDVERSPFVRLMDRAIKVWQGE